MCWDKALRYVVENEGDTRYTLRDKYEEEKSPGRQGCVGSCLGKCVSVRVTSQSFYQFRLARAFETSKCLCFEDWRRFPCAASLINVPVCRTHKSEINSTEIQVLETRGGRMNLSQPSRFKSSVANPVAFLPDLWIRSWKFGSGSGSYLQAFLNLSKQHVNAILLSDLNI